ncbi:hypothetical protein ONZ51_g7821 [Trametes cubensis]|uniref:ATP-dependent DNA helicase n=1 Tax=Trametes cubensis TaxID=1111947 RepID=A0AAD7TPG6_9APHY|nr:hypothetical protein ONZ51_g7821 [Trametes cubensis]
MFQFKNIEISYGAKGLAQPGDLVIRASLHDVVCLWDYWRSGQLRKLAEAHGITVTTRLRASDIVATLMRHNCDGCPSSLEYVFNLLKSPRVLSRKDMGRNPGEPRIIQYVANRETEGTQSGSSNHLEQLSEHLTGGMPTFDSDTHLDPADETLIRSIVTDWEQAMSIDAIIEPVCAACGRRTTNEKIAIVQATKIDFSLLCNPGLPESVLPVSYNRAAYGNAILHPKGLTVLDRTDAIRVCKECLGSLSNGRMPKFALANWLYYGHERLPADVRHDFHAATHVEKLLVSRARASRISYKFSQLPGHYLEGTDPRISQSCVKGNIAVHPQDATHLNQALPPSSDAIRDTVCAVFVGETKPTRETIGKLKPVLVRKSRVKRMIDFLVAHNPCYAPTTNFHGFSQRNLDELFGPGTHSLDEGVPCSMEIGHIKASTAVTGATDSYVPGQEDELQSDRDDMLMDTIGYTDNDNSPIDYASMMMRALSHCLNGGSFIKSQAGSELIPDFENPHLLSWLFPHLDPWGISGFYDARRRIRLTLDQQLQYLMTVADSPFTNDPDFAFVYYNISQKRAVFESITFRVPASQRASITEKLLEVDLGRLDKLIELFKSNPQFKPSDLEDVKIMKLLSRVNTVARDLPGSNGYKVMLRNQIHALMNFNGTPTFFITLNPSDRDHPIVRLYAGDDVDVVSEMRGEELSRWQRTKIASRHPSACARFFDRMISQFIRIILRHKGSKRGLFGRCKAYYGTVEAQGRGTLHCHMLIWLEGHLSPQQLRDKLVSSEEYRDRMFRWLESIIKCELPGTQAVVEEKEGVPIPRPERSSGESHPGANPAASIHQFARHEDFIAALNASVTELVQVYNWHEHTLTCFKYVPKGVVPQDPQQQDALCRMRIDGTTCSETRLDEETGAVVLRRLHPRIANYNDLIIFLMRCNMDIKFIGSGEAAKVLLYYVTDYITKPSLPAHVGLAALSYAIQKTNEKFPDIADQSRESEDRGKSVRGALTLTVNRMMSRQEISHQQVLSYIVGGGDVYRSHSFRALHWGSFDRMFAAYEARRAVHTSQPGASEDSPHAAASQDRTGSTSAQYGNLAEFPERIEMYGAVHGESSVAEVGMQAGNDEAEMTYARNGSAPDDENETGADGNDIDRHTDSIDVSHSEGVRVDGIDEEVYTLKLESGTISSVNQQQDYIYRSRQPPFDSMCLYEFVGTVEKVNKNSDRRYASGVSDIDDSVMALGHEPRAEPSRGRPAEPRGSFSSPDHTQYRTHHLRRRSEWLVPVVLGDRTPRSDRGEEEKDQWARMMLILFLPWRDAGDLREPLESWTDAFERQQSRISSTHHQIIHNMNMLSECQDVRDAHRDMRRAEALAFLRDGMPADDCNKHTGLDDENMDQDFQLFTGVDTCDAYDDVGELSASQASLEAQIGHGSREMLDLCYSTNTPIGSSETGALRAETEGDKATISAHSSTMGQLKRQRRPRMEGGEGDVIDRPSKRRRKADRAEAVTKAVLDDSKSDNTYQHNDSSSSQSGHELMDRIVIDMGLNANPEQERAFRIIAEHVLSNDDQLLMYIAGVGGTGKTHVVKAIVKFFEGLGRANEILIGAPTGAAALNINGYTVHSLILLNNRSKDSLSTLRRMWSSVRYFIIDEISMIGAKFLAQISRRLQLAKGDNGGLAIKPFGGINIIFTGDFGQLKPVQASSLYSHSLLNDPKLQVIRDFTGVDGLQGIYLWRQVMTVVKLTKNQRQSADPGYADLLARVREGKATSRGDVPVGGQNDVEVLYRRLMQNVGESDASSFRDFKDAPIIVGNKALRDALNARLIAHRAKECNELVKAFFSKDKIDGILVHGDVQRGLWRLPSKITKDSLGRLPLFRGMRVMIQENIAFGHRLVNGAEGAVEKVLYEETEGILYATVAYVRIPGAGQVCHDLPIDLVPVFPETVKFKCTMLVSGQKVVKEITRKQLPLVPAYAYTDYKGQGKSLTYAVVDIASANSLQGVYVMLSRVRSLSGLLILRAFTPNKVCSRLSQELRDELARIDGLAEDTRRRYEHRSQR